MHIYKYILIYLHTYIPIYACEVQSTVVLMAVSGGQSAWVNNGGITREYTHIHGSLWYLCDLQFLKL